MNFVSDNDDLKLEISDRDSYYNKVAFINFLNLVTMFVSNNVESGEVDEDSDTDELLGKSLPPHVIDLIKRSNWFSEFLGYADGSDENEITTVENIRSLTEDFNIISYALRAEIIQQNMEFPKSLEKTKYYPGEKCEGERCFGLSENTVIFSIHKYLICHRIARINNELKIVELFSVIDEM